MTVSMGEHKSLIKVTSKGQSAITHFPDINEVILHESADSEQSTRLSTLKF
jgi:predicted MarR family transcription regulator